MRISRKKIISLLRIIPAVMCVAAAIIYFASGKSISAEELAGFAPENYFFAAVFVVLAFTVKSMVVFFPVIILRIAVGYIFPPVFAVIVNIIGMTGEVLLPYLIGRLSGAGTMVKLANKYPKLKSIVASQHDNEMFLAFFLREINILPLDIVSAYLGAINVPLKKYMTGSMLGLLPGIITSTLIGVSIENPGSALFLVSMLSTAGLSIISLLAYEYYLKRHKTAKSATTEKKTEETVA